MLFMTKKYNIASIMNCMELRKVFKMEKIKFSELPKRIHAEFVIFAEPVNKVVRIRPMYTHQPTVMMTTMYFTFRPDLSKG